MHHLYHIVLWQQTTGLNISDCSTILEFGAGFGNTARIISKLNINLTDYCIVDLEGPRKFQKWYVNQTAPTSPVRWLEPEQVKNLPARGFDLFISTWALSETPAIIFNNYTNNGFFADHGLVAWEPAKPGFPESSNFDSLMVESGVPIIESPHQGSKYALW